MRGFVFAIVFIMVFSTLLVSIPAGLQGNENTPSELVGIDPSLFAGFANSENWTRSACSLAGGIWRYDYSLGDKDWTFLMLDGVDNPLTISAKDYWLGWFWFGAVLSTTFVSLDGEERGADLTMSEIEEDAPDGTVRYDMTFEASGEDAGSFVVYWNTTLYTDPLDAWDNDVLHMIHGTGLANTATNNIGALLVSLLFLQIPNVPVLVNMFLAVPIWACIIYVLWFVVKEMIPFV